MPRVSEHHPRGRELSSYLDGGLPGRRAKTVARHVETCPTCARELAALRRVKVALASQQEVEVRPGWLAPPPPAPVSFQDEVRQHLVQMSNPLGDQTSYVVEARYP